MRELDVPLLQRWLMWAGVRWGATVDPIRRPGWWADAPAVIAISLAAAPIVIPPSLVVLAALAVWRLAEALTGQQP